MAQEIDNQYKLLSNQLKSIKEYSCNGLDMQTYIALDLL